MAAPILEERHNIPPITINGIGEDISSFIYTEKITEA